MRATLCEVCHTAADMQCKHCYRTLCLTCSAMVTCAHSQAGDHTLLHKRLPIPISQVRGPQARLTSLTLTKEQDSMALQGRPTQTYLFRVDDELEYAQVLWCPYHDGSGRGDAGVHWKGKVIWRDSAHPYEAVQSVCSTRSRK